MSFDLLSATTLLFIAAISFSGLTIITCHVFMRDKTKQRQRRIRQRLLTVGVGTVVGAYIILQLVQVSHSSDSIPIQLMVWSFPFMLSITLLPYAFHDKRDRLLALVCVPVSLVLALLCINSYYQYYPTLGSLFDKNDAVSKTSRQAPKARQGRTPLEAYYAPLPDQPKAGELKVLAIPASRHFSPRQGYIYLPPALHDNSSLELPVIVLLPGYPGSPVDWMHGGIEKIMNNFAAAHKGLAPIVAVVDFGGVAAQDTECIDSKMGDVETYLAKDVPEYLKKNFQITSNPNTWSIAGYSAGGTCAAMIALRNPDVYRNYLNITGDSQPTLGTPSQTLQKLYDNNVANQRAHTPNILLQQQKKPSYAKMRAGYYNASSDPQAQTQRIAEQVRYAKSAGLHVRFKVLDGHHSFNVWKAGFEDGLPWLMQELNIYK